MKKLLLISTLGMLLFMACTKHEELPAYSTPSTVFSVNSKMSHTKDSVNFGDTIFLTVTGQLADTLNTVSSSFKIYSGTLSSAGAFTSSGNLAGAYYASALAKTITAPVSPSTLYNWTSKVSIPVPSVAHKIAILVSGTFENSLSLATQFGNQTASDSKGVYVK